MPGLVVGCGKEKPAVKESSESGELLLASTS